MDDGTLYRVEADKSLRIIPPAGDRQKLFEEVHGGLFGEHLREAKMHSEPLLVAENACGDRPHVLVMSHLCCS